MVQDSIFKKLVSIHCKFYGIVKRECSKTDAQWTIAWNSESLKIIPYIVYLNSLNISQLRVLYFEIRFKVTSFANTIHFSIKQAEAPFSLANNIPDATNILHEELDHHNNWSWSDERRLWLYCGSWLEELPASTPLINCVVFANLVCSPCASHRTYYGYEKYGAVTGRGATVFVIVCR